MTVPDLTEAEQARVTLAAELRRGMHALVASEPDVPTLRAMVDVLSAQFDLLEAAHRRGFNLPRPDFGTPTLAPADGGVFPDALDRPISGSGNPFSVPFEMQRDGDEVVAEVSLDVGFGGAPGRSHGGFVSAIFDDLFGSLPMLLGKIAFTASLTVNYVAPSPTLAVVEYRGRIDRVEGKKIFVSGEARHDGTVVTTATGLFIDATEYMAELAVLAGTE